MKREKEDSIASDSRVNDMLNKVNKMLNDNTAW